MPQDPLQIALDHHRAGRLQQAAAGYRTLIDQDPANAEATHWLGVLAYQAGRPDQAVPLLERAVALRPDDPAYQHNLAQACLDSGRTDHAIQAFERAAKLVPDRADTLMAWGLAHLTRANPGDAPAAAFAFRQAHLAGLDTADLHHRWGLAELAAGRPDDAIAQLQLALDQKPDDAAAYHHLALAHRYKADIKQVRRCLNKALEIDPTRTRAWHALATLDAEAGNLDIAAALFRKAIKADPNYAAAHSGLGRVLELAGQKRESLAAFAQAVRVARSRPRKGAPTPLPDAIADLEQKLSGPKAIELHHAMAANADIFSPTRVPADTLAKLFDRYAASFDDHLRGQLQYGVPELITEAVAATRPEKQLDVLDLGCGTGLCGPLLRPLAAHLCGVDLSAAMIDKATALQVYDHLEVGELLDTLRKVPKSFDLLIAADVLIYTGDLGPTFEAAAGALRPGGLLAFSVEAGGGERYHLHQKTLRFTHAKSYLQRLAQIHGFAEESFDPIVIRVEGGQPVCGYLIVLRWPGEG
jgi:predicted TPR repeat methyltransferase